MTGASRLNKELAYGEQNFSLRQAQRSAFGRIETRLRRAITQALRARLWALHAQTKSSPRRAKPSALGRIETRLRRADNPTLSL